MPPADFGTPPSGEVPILFNDHHVYSKPDRLKQNRVLAALVRGNEILVPLRSMFEQMGATVSYDPASKTADVSKPGSDVKVTVGKPEVVINGESRPLDVPPEIYKGVDRRSGPRHLRRHGRLRPVGSREEGRRRPLRSGAGSDPAAHAAADAAPPTPKPTPRRPPPPPPPPTPDAGTDAEAGQLRALHRRRLHLRTEGLQRVLARQHRQRQLVRRPRRRASSRRSACPG